MPPRIVLPLLAAAVLALAVAAPASASSVAYIDDHKPWFSSPEDDGAQGITVAKHSRTVPSVLVAACDIPAAGKASSATFSPSPAGPPAPRSPRGSRSRSSR
jgi:hypothetical protein